jgi:Cu(I)/Ag(I) efflux system membrane fusion protein
VALGDGKFQPRVVRLGASDGDHVEVQDGLAAGDKIVTRANFLVDSESRLKASLQALSGGK